MFAVTVRGSGAMALTAAPQLASFSELRELARTPGIRAWIELRKQEIICRDWDIIPSPEAAKSLQGDYKAMRAWSKASEEATGFFRRPDPDFWRLDSWLGEVVEDLLVADAAAVFLRETAGAGKGLLGSDIWCLSLLDAATVEPAVSKLGVLQGYVQYLGEVPRRDFAAMAAGPPEGLKVHRRYPKDRCLYLSMSRRAWTPFGFSPLEQSIRVREDGSTDPDATATALSDGIGTDGPWWAAFQRFVKEGLFNAVLDRCAGDSLRWEWGTPETS
jgi:hypothetical protein